MKKRITVEQAFGEVLRERRKEAQKTQEVVALDAELDRTYISMLERGLRQPTLETILSLSRALGLPAADIVASVESKLNH